MGARIKADEECMLGIIGTSRVHEPMDEAFAKGRAVRFLHCGYFHAPRQASDLIEIGYGLKPLEEHAARWFFRKDQTPHNTFDRRLWLADPSAVEALRGRIQGCSAYLVEISSLQTFRWGRYSLQGNPNVDQDVPYKDVWQRGYYADFASQMEVDVYHADTDETQQCLAQISKITDKPIVVTSHLTPTLGGHKARVDVQNIVREATELAGLRFIDTCDLVDEYGFRVLAGGVTDIHHLPYEALPALVDRIFASLN